MQSNLTNPKLLNGSVILDAC